MYPTSSKSQKGTVNVIDALTNMEKRRIEPTTLVSNWTYDQGDVASVLAMVSSVLLTTPERLLSLSPVWIVICVFSD